MNDKNLEFYDKLGVSHFKELAAKGGFDTYIDLELIYPYVKSASSILELGAGYGRCIDFFLNKKFKGKITAIEQSNVLMAHLKAEYGNIENIELLQEDFKTLPLSQKVDLTLWMWSGIVDFSKEEQFYSIQKIYNILNPGGRLIIDVPRIGFQTIGNHKDEKNLSFQTPFGTLNCYIPDEEEMKEAQKKIAYKDLKIINYKTTTDKERTIYIFEK